MAFGHGALAWPSRATVSRSSSLITGSNTSSAEAVVRET
jgi:hypothetical protein